MNELHPAWLILISMGISLIPILVGVSTSYLKISIVLSMLKSGLGTQQVPATLVIMTISMALSIYVMGPVISSTFEQSKALSQLNLKDNPTSKSLEALSSLLKPWKEFMQKHSGKRELKVLEDLDRVKDVKSELPQESTSGANAELEFRVLMPAFVLTELKEAFAMGFALLLPFLVIDLIVANLLVGMGMYMVSPVMISLPLKLLVFVMCDGWLLLAKGLVLSYV